jgi:hypothetical protein
MSFLEVLRKSRNQAQAPVDPWRLRLERARGKVDYNGLEFISTQSLFDFLEVPQRARTAGACRRLANMMRELGWSPIKTRGLTQSGFRDKIRGLQRTSAARSYHDVPDAGARPGARPNGEFGACLRHAGPTT